MSEEVNPVRPMTKPDSRAAPKASTPPAEQNSAHTATVANVNTTTKASAMTAKLLNPNFTNNKLDGVSVIKFSDGPERYAKDDLGLGYLFADTFYDRLRYVSDANNYYYFDGCVWKEDIGGVYVRQCVKAFIEDLKKKFSDDEVFIEEISKRSKRETIIKEAKDVHAISLSDFDKDPYLLNCSNVTIDLRTGEFHPHDPADFLSKKINTNYDPDSKCERFEQFIDQIMCGDKTLTLYLQKCLGYGLSGDTSEECLFILYGPTTRNGKGTLMESIYIVLGDYSRTIQPDSLAQRKASGSGHSDDIARLAGIRFVNASELPNDMKLNAAIVKQMTGGDTVTTRFIYKGFFEYRPQFKIFINTNHLPEVADDSLFSSGRLKLIPFDKHFDETEQDPGLKKIFREDNSRSAILNWLLEGYKRYKSDADRLALPPKAEKLLIEYRKSSDAVGLYIENRLEPCSEEIRTKTLKFHTDFLEWCKNEDIAEISLKEFVQTLRQKKLLARDRDIGHYIKSFKIKPKTR